MLSATSIFSQILTIRYIVMWIYMWCQTKIDYLEKKAVVIFFATGVYPKCTGVAPLIISSLETDIKYTQQNFSFSLKKKKTDFFLILPLVLWVWVWLKISVWYSAVPYVFIITALEQTSNKTEYLVCDFLPLKGSPFQNLLINQCICTSVPEIKSISA